MELLHWGRVDMKTRAVFCAIKEFDLYYADDDKLCGGCVNKRVMYVCIVGF